MSLGGHLSLAEFSFPRDLSGHQTEMSLPEDPDTKLVCQETFPAGVWGASIQAYN